MGRSLKRRGSQKTCLNIGFTFEDRSKKQYPADKKWEIPGSI